MLLRSGVMDIHAWHGVASVELRRKQRIPHDVRRRKEHNDALDHVPPLPSYTTRKITSATEELSCFFIFLLSCPTGYTKLNRPKPGSVQRTHCIYLVYGSRVSVSPCSCVYDQSSTMVITEAESECESLQLHIWYDRSTAYHNHGQLLLVHERER
jgi:hypothetical protein